ncbi:MAG: penicillin-binding Tp47 domain C-containing protein [Coriobacteriia bacterium]|nr:penicillin-binding Tp47 domain C-containing protein [Coriobacteriia bacterium]
MEEREKVWRHLTALGGKAARGAVVAALTVSMMPISAFAYEGTEAGSTATNTVPASAQAEGQTPSNGDYTAVSAASEGDTGSSTYDLGKIADGTYSADAVVSDDGATVDGVSTGVEDDEFAGYTLTVNVTVADHKITKVEVSSTASSESISYVSKATDGKKNVSGVPAKIVEAQSVDVDNVSSATVSSLAIKAATAKALANASTDTDPVEDEYTYGYAALTWAEYWAAEDVQAAGSTETSDVIDAHGETDKGAFDVVTRATTNHGLHRGSYQCTAVIKCTDGTEFSLLTWADDGASFTTTDGKTVTWNRGTMTCDGQSYTMAEYDVEGLKYVPVKVKTSDLDAFKASYAFVENGGTLAGGYSEKNLAAYSVTAEVDADTNGLKTATKSDDGSFTFGAAVTGTGSGIKDQALKTATGIEPKVKNGDGTYGEFLRVDLNGDYGDLGANMQSVTWTYYGSDSTRTTALATYGTKFAADNWMHKSMGIQLGLTESARCQLPEGTDGTGYWTLTVHALGYADYTYEFEATSENIAAPKPVSGATKASLQKLADTANAKIEGNYSAETWAPFATELDETNELLAKDGLTESEARTQISHLTEAMDALVRTAPEAGSYVLMNIPYSDFYAAETANNDTKVDVFTSATKNKTKNTGLAGGTYHTEDGSEITGITFAVKVSDDAVEKIDWSKLTRAESADALAAAGSYSYVVLGEDEAPATYKQLSVAADGSYAFGAVEGAAATELDGSAEAKFTTESTYGDYELDFKADSSVYAALKDATIYGAVLNTTDGTGYGLRHLENIWKTGKHGVEFAWCAGFTEKVHNCPTSSEHYKSIMGKTLSSVTVYTSAGTYQISLGENGVYVPVKTADATVKADDVLLDDGAELAVEVSLPEGFDPEYSIDGTVVEPSQTRSSLSFDVSALKPGSHTIKVTDKSGAYAAISDAFVASTSKVVAQYQDGKLAKAEGASDEEFANYLANVTSVSVDGTAYSASGRGSVKVIDSDGMILTSAASGQGDAAKKVFNGYGSYAVSVTSTGYGALDFTFVYEAEKDELKQAIADAATLEESNYSTSTWAAYQKAVAAGQEIVDNVSASDDEVSAAAKAIADARAALAPSPRISLNEAVANARKLNESDYTKASWKTFQSALDAAKKVAADASATDAQIEAARDALVNAQTNLATAATSDQKTDLKVEIGRADVLNESDYTADSWKAYQNALAAAKKVAASDDASAAEVAQAKDALAAARKALTKKPAGQGSTEAQQAAANNGDAANGNGKKTPKTSDASLAVSGIAALGAALTGIAATIRRRLKR